MPSVRLLVAVCFMIWKFSHRA